MTCCLKQLGLNSAFGVDKLRHKNASAPISMCDLSTPKGENLLWSWLRNKRIVGIFLAPPCGTASRAREIPLKRKRMTTPGPKPLRSDDHPNGLPGLGWVDKLKVSLANKLYHLTAKIVNWCTDHDIIVCVENPQHSLFWSTTFWQAVSHLLEYTILHSCMFGGARQKKTMLAHNAAEFRSLAVTCSGQSASHRHLPWGVREHNFATAEETAYPMPLARAIANCFVLSFCNKGIRHSPITLHDVQPISLDALKAMRAQTGQQPRASKLPPIVPTFARKLHISGQPSELPSFLLHQALPQPLTVRAPAHTVVLPKGARLCAIQPTSVFKGGKFLADCRLEAPGVVHDIDPTDEPIVQSWGVPRTEEEFVQQAAKHGHPSKIESLLPDVLSKAVDRFANSTSSERCAARVRNLKFWSQRARDLIQKESDLKQTMPPSVRDVLASKRILLWKEMLESVGYPDMSVVDEFSSGSTLTGEVPATGLWPLKFAPAQMTEADLFEVSARDRAAFRNGPFLKADAEMAQTVWEQTLQEVRDGALEGPIDLNLIPEHYPLSRRFGVKQGSKVRNVDDFSMSGVNACVQANESPKPHTLDVIASLCASLMQSGQNARSTAWKARSFDLKGAYRQCAVNPVSEPFSYIVVCNPNNDTPYAFKMKALPFGSVKSVHAFLRVAHSIWYLGAALFDILWCNYFDDFVTFSPDSEAKSVTDTIHMLFDLTGWKFAREGDKATPFDSTVKALGVLIDVANMATGLTLFDNTPMRKADLISSLDKILEQGHLPRAEALRLRGRLQFASGQLFGRTSKACLAVLTAHAYSQTTGKLSAAAISALRLHRDMLGGSIPRKISARASQTWILFTDASFEGSNDNPYAGLGAVLCDGSGVVRRFISHEIESEVLTFLNPSKKKTIIYECEYLAVWCALNRWKQFIAGQHILIFIDNNAVRDSLISCQTSSPVARAIMSQILDLECKAGLFAWCARVPTDSNISDGPSRQICSVVLKLKAERDSAELNAAIKCLVIPRGGE